MLTEALFAPSLLPARCGHLETLLLSHTDVADIDFTENGCSLCYPHMDTIRLTHTHTHTRTHACAHGCTRTHTQTQKAPWSDIIFWLWNPSCITQYRDLKRVFDSANTKHNKQTLSPHRNRGMVFDFVNSQHNKQTLSSRSPHASAPPSSLWNKHFSKISVFLHRSFDCLNVAKKQLDIKSWKLES